MEKWKQSSFSFNAIVENNRKTKDTVEPYQSSGLPRRTLSEHEHFNCQVTRMISPSADGTTQKIRSDLEAYTARRAAKRATCENPPSSHSSSMEILDFWPEESCPTPDKLAMLSSFRAQWRNLYYVTMVLTWGIEDRSRNEVHTLLFCTV